MNDESIIIHTKKKKGESHGCLRQLVKNGEALVQLNMVAAIIPWRKPSKIKYNCQNI